VNVSFVPTDRSPILPLLVNGEPEQVDEVRAKEILSAEDLEIRVDLGLGSESAKYWTCDFGYVSALRGMLNACSFISADVYMTYKGVH
jgi:glutamate N-acetyltransferase / amino-acid N-acetyltransferase